MFNANRARTATQHLADSVRVEPGDDVKVEQLLFLHVELVERRPHSGEFLASPEVVALRQGFDRIATAPGLLDDVAQDAEEPSVEARGRSFE